MGSFRGRVRKLERQMEADLLTVEHGDGTVSRWPLRGDLFKEVFLHETEWGGRRHEGEDPGPVHPFVMALRTATNLEALMAEHGTMLGFRVGEDEIVRGLRERPIPSSAARAQSTCPRRPHMGQVSDLSWRNLKTRRCFG